MHATAHSLPTSNLDLLAGVKPKAYSYLRFSTPEQIKGDSYRRQAALAKEYTARHGLELDTELTFEDLGKSAYRGRNFIDGELGAFKRAVEDGFILRGSFLLVESLDRISRMTPRKAARILEEVCELGVVVVTLADGKAYTAESLDEDPLSFLLAIMVFMRANEESKTKARRLTSVWEAKRKRIENGEALRLTSRCPYWIKPSASSAGFELIPERAEVVQRIFAMALEGKGKNMIVDVLHREGIPVFGTGKHWHTTYIDKILNNTASYGALTPMRFQTVDGKRVRERLETIDGYYPAAVDKATFESIHALKRSRNPRRGRHASSELKNIFGCLAVCPLCGDTVTRVMKNEREGWVYLVCQRARVRAGCEYRAVRYAQAEEAFLAQHEALLAECPSGDADLDLREAQIRAEADAVGDALHKLLEAIEGGLDTAQYPTIRKRLGTLEQAREEVAERLSEVLREKATYSAQVVAKRVDTLRRELLAVREGAPLVRGKVNALLREIFSKVVVDHQSQSLIFHWVQGGESEILYGF